MNTPNSLYDRFIDRLRTPGEQIAIGVVLLLLPTAAAALDGMLQSFFPSGSWRIAYLPVVMILYILVVSQPLGRSNRVALQTFRSIVQVDDATYDRLVCQASHVNLAYELAAMSIGMCLGLYSVSTWGLESGFYWSKLYLYLAVGVMYALVAWIFLISFSWTRLTRVLHRQPLQFDLFDTRPFEPVGRQSLIIALVIIGGLTISLLFTFQPESLRLPIFWVINAVMVLIPVVIFFLSMRPVHGLLLAEKKSQLKRVQRLVLDASRELVRRMEQEETGARLAETSTLAAELSALAVYEQHLESARTWPYNTGMLRTLFFGVLVPIGTLVARMISELGLADF
jgi:hypothetical protein